MVPSLLQVGQGRTDVDDYFVGTLEVVATLIEVESTDNQQIWILVELYPTQSVTYHRAVPSRRGSALSVSLSLSRGPQPGG